MHRLRLPLLLFLILSYHAMNTELTAQDRTGETVRITTTDGNVFIGEVIEESENRIILRVSGVGEVTVEKNNIRSITILDEQQMRDGVYWYPNPHGTRYFFAPNAIGLEKGTGYYQNTWILFNNANYGVTNNFSAGAGLVPTFLFGDSSLPYWLLPKVSVPVSPGSFYLGAGALILGIVGDDPAGHFGLIYGNATAGNLDRNITVGIGYGFGGGEISDTPLVNVSGLYRSGKAFQWVGEIYFLPGIGGSGFGIFGGRWAPENFALDFGLARTFTDIDIIGVPWLSVTIPFGNR